MATQAQIEANRRNAQKSTGPKTPEGKKKVSQNATTHGFYAKNALVSRDDAAEFESYRAAMLKDLAPCGQLETCLADRVIAITWQLARSDRLECECHDTFGAIRLQDFSRNHRLDRISIYEQRIHKLLLIAVRQFETVRQKRNKIAEQSPAYYIVNKLQEKS